MAKTKLRDEIEMLYAKHFKNSYAKLSDRVNMIEYRGIGLFRRNAGYIIYFRDSMFSQEQLDTINDRYRITVHYDNNSSVIVRNVRNYSFVNNRNIDKPTRGYLEVVCLNEKDAVELFKYLCESY